MRQLPLFHIPIQAGNHCVDSVEHRCATRCFAWAKLPGGSLSQYPSPTIQRQLLHGLFESAGCPDLSVFICTYLAGDAFIQTRFSSLALSAGISVDRKRLSLLLQFQCILQHWYLCNFFFFFFGLLAGDYVSCCYDMSFQNGFDHRLSPSCEKNETLHPLRGHKG